MLSSIEPKQWSDESRAETWVDLQGGAGTVTMGTGHKVGVGRGECKQHGSAGTQASGSDRGRKTYFYQTNGTRGRAATHLGLTYILWVFWGAFHVNLINVPRMRIGRPMRYPHQTHGRPMGDP